MKHIKNLFYIIAAIRSGTYRRTIAGQFKVEKSTVFWHCKYIDDPHIITADKEIRLEFIGEGKFRINDFSAQKITGNKKKITAYNVEIITFDKFKTRLSNLVSFEGIKAKKLDKDMRVWYRIFKRAGFTTVRQFAKYQFPTDVK
jgi:hypothetical protein